MRRWHAMLLLLIANALWGTAWPVAKLATAELPANVVAGLRLVVASLLFWLIMAATRRRGAAGAPMPTRGEMARIMLLGLLGLGLAYLLAYSGLALTRASDASLMIIGEVIFTTLLAALLAGDNVTPTRMAGVALGAAGIAVLVLDGATGDGAGGGQRVLGNLLILTSLLLQALYSVLGTNHVRRYSPLLVNTLLYTGTLIFWVPALSWELPRLEAWPAPTAILAILYLAAVCSVGCMLLWFSALRAYGAAFGAPTLFVQPVVGTALSIFVLDEPLTTPLLAGGACVLLALALITFEGVGRPQAPSHSAPAPESRGD